VIERNVTLSTGVVLNIMPVSPWLMQSIFEDADKIKPKVPVVRIEADQRDEENPNDPVYLEQLKDWDKARTARVQDTVIAWGTMVGSLPQGFPPVDDPGWQEMARFTGHAIEDSRIARYVTWVKWVAGPEIADSAEIMKAVQLAAGVPEAQVAAAAELFRNRVQGSADSGGKS
jgi:hypothetical protein